MNITVSPKVVAVSPVAKSGGLQAESKSDRLERMRQFWSSKDTAVIWYVGQLLACMAEDGRSLAAHVYDGDSITLTSLEVLTVTNQSRTLELAEPLIISIETTADKANGWGCPACHSAHGTGVSSSHAKKSVPGLEHNHWYYNPSTKRLFVISDTCHSTYCVDLMPGDSPKAQERAWRKRVVTVPDAPATTATVKAS